ncbi:hypothetical protein F5Y12DRAFT_712319 [Xylaria sp. FL1777]|nr:hypothetical protein F5Y12DRAFT_712319 [Xylaria sp. FL1777]
MISSYNPPFTCYPMVGLTTDGAGDGHPLDVVQPSIPRYNVNENNGTVPKYTREYLQKLSMAVDSRLKTNDDEISYHAGALTKAQKVHKYLLGVLVVLAMVWLATAIILLVAVFKSHDFAKKHGTTKSH